MLIARPAIANERLKHDGVDDVVPQLKSAKALGVKFPKSIQVQATKLIE